VVEESGILVFCEEADAKLASISGELLGLGSRLSREMGQDLIAVLIGNNVFGLAQEAIAFGAKKVYVTDDPILKDYLTDSYLPVMDKIVKLASPQVVLFGQTSIGRDLAPRLAFRLNSAAVLDCVALAVDPITRRILMTKPVFGGNALAVQSCECEPQIATVRSKTMPPGVKDPTNTGETVVVPAGIDPSTLRTRIVDRKVEAAAAVKLESARVIVCGGRGIGGPDGFKQLQELATLIKGVVGASRPPCDNQWVPDTMQIGLTGKIVSPDLYIAIGLSGSSQHLSGCSGSKIIVAMNKDPDANIFKVATYGIVADWKRALPAFISKVKQLQT
jgi:electron transfer flavoprotein alpha subunit